jgi:outer membrane protein insertion porin family
MRLPLMCAFSAALTAPFLCGQGFPLEGLRITGNAAIPAERIVAAAGLKIGQTVTERDFNAARDRLLSTGAFESVGFEYKPSAAGTGYDAVFEVVEASPLLAYRFEGLGRTDAVLREVLRQQEPVFGDRIPATPQVMNRYAAALAKYLNEPEVRAELNNDLPGEPTIVFRPPGARANVSAVRFKGNETLPSPELAAAMSRVAVGAVYSEPLFRQMLEQTVRPMYEERGRIRVSFPVIAVDKSTENQGLEVTVTVEEGPVYRLGEVRLEGTPRSQAEELNKVAAWKTGEIFNAVEAAGAVDRIKKRFHAQGYLRAAAEVTREIRDADRAVNLTVKLDPGPRFTMGELHIQGLDILSEPAIRKAWGLPQGAPYQDGYADAFVKRIMDEGWFDNLARVGAEADIHDAALTVDVTLTFEGARLAPEDRRRRPR